MTGDFGPYLGIGGLGIAALSLIVNRGSRRDALFSRFYEEQLKRVSMVASHLHGILERLLSAKSRSELKEIIQSVPGCLLCVDANCEAVVFFPPGWFFLLARKCEEAVKLSARLTTSSDESEIIEIAAETYLVIWHLASDLGLVVGNQAYIAHHWKVVRDLQKKALLKWLMHPRGYRSRDRAMLAAHFRKACGN